MKIGIICYPTYGGSGVVASELGLALANQGVHVHVISYELPFRLPFYHPNMHYHEVELPAYPVFSKYPPITLALASKIIELIRQEDLDILHAHYAIPHTMGAYLARQVIGKKLPKIITTLHGTDITLIGQQPSFYEMVKFSIESSDAVTCVSHYLQQETEKVFRIERHLDVIYNFVDTNRYQPEYKSKKDCPFHMQENCPFLNKKEKLLVHISNFRTAKNIPAVIRTFARVADKVPSRLVMVGDGPDLSLANQLTKELHLQNKVEFTGKISSVECFLPKADVFFLPSVTESFGLALLEAMSCGVPTVSSNVGGLPEVVEDSVTGFLCEPEDERTMSERIIYLFTNPEQAKAMGEEARRRVIQHFDANLIIEQYFKLYEKVLET